MATHVAGVLADNVKRKRTKTDSEMKEKVYLFGAYIALSKDQTTEGYGNFLHCYDSLPTYDKLKDKLKESISIECDVVILNLQFLTKEQFFALKGEEKQETPSDLLDKKIANCELSIKVKLICRQNGLNTVRDVCRLAKTDWLKFHNGGKKSLGEIDDFLKDNGLDWGMNV